MAVGSRTAAPVLSSPVHRPLGGSCSAGSCGGLVESAWARCRGPTAAGGRRSTPPGRIGVGRREARARPEGRAVDVEVGDERVAEAHARRCPRSGGRRRRARRRCASRDEPRVSTMFTLSMPGGGCYAQGLGGDRTVSLSRFEPFSYRVPCHAGGGGSWTFGTVRRVRVLGCFSRQCRRRGSSGSPSSSSTARASTHFG